MLSVAQAVHHPETPGSATKHSSLGHSWSSERSSMLKRRKTESECCIIDKKSTTSIESISKQYHFNGQEVTLTAIPKSQNQIKSAKFIKIQETSIDNRSQPEDIEDDKIASTAVISLLEKSEEVQLIKLDSTNKKKMYESDNNNSSSDSSQISDTESKQKNTSFHSLINPIAELSEVTIEPCSKSQKTSQSTSVTTSTNFCDDKKQKTNLPSRLAKAQEFLKNKEKNSLKITFVSRTRSAEEKQPFNSEFNQTEFEEFFTDDIFNKPTFSSSKSPIYNREPEHQISVSTVSDYEPFNVGVSSDCFYVNNRDKPYYATGFPNPPSENRCWVNSTLQALFALPIMNDVELLDTVHCSKLMSALINVYIFWRKGNTDSHSFDHTFNIFKDELSALDKLYSSKAQQDVSEFIMNLINFIKTEFENVMSKESHHTEIENIPNNEQDAPRRLQNSVPDTNKRLPLVNISTSTMQLRSNNLNNVKANSSLNKSKSETQENSNPIDEYFSLYMVENLSCNNCLKQRQQKVENLMLYVDLPSENHGTSVDLLEMINTTYGTEQRDIKCESCEYGIHSMVTQLKRPPKILTIQVKRYEMTNDGLITKKSTCVEIPKLLKLDSLVINNNQDFSHFPEYEPICIISHIGDNIDSGHYISFVKHQDQWFYYDDINVKLLTPEEVFKCVQNNAYVIFFQDTELSQNVTNLTDQNNKNNTTC